MRRLVQGLCGSVIGLVMFVVVLAGVNSLWRDAPDGPAFGLSAFGALLASGLVGTALSAEARRAPTGRRVASVAGAAAGGLAVVLAGWWLIGRGVQADIAAQPAAARSGLNGAGLGVAYGVFQVLASAALLVIAGALTAPLAAGLASGPTPAGARHTPEQAPNPTRPARGPDTGHAEF